MKNHGVAEGLPNREISRQIGAMRHRVRLLPALLSALLAAGCSRIIEADQARLCRMSLPAIAEPDAEIAIAGQSEAPDGKSVRIDFTASVDRAPPRPHFALCRFREAGRPRRSGDLIGLETDAGELSQFQLAMLARFWLATPEARAADPAPLGDISALPQAPAPLAYALQQAINGAPLAAIYALLAAAYSLVYGLVGRINLAFGELAAAGGYAAAFGALLLGAAAPAATLVAAMVLAVSTAGAYGLVQAKFVFAPLHRASGQQALVAAVGLALFLQEFLRLTQGPTLHWIAPIFNEPVALLRAGAFIVTTTPNTVLAAGIALCAASALLLIVKRSRYGREWRAVSDDALAAQLCGVAPDRVFAQTFVLASVFAGLSGFLMTMAYGAVGYAAAPILGLKALIAAILGGIGSVPGAFLGGLLVGLFEALWSAYFDIDYRDFVVFGLLALLLTLRPRGLLGVVAAGGGGFGARPS